MRTPSALVSLAMTLAATSACYAGFTGFTTDRVVTAAGNSQYSVFANFDSTGLPSGKSWVFLNAFNYQRVAGSMNAIHQDAAQDVDGNPTCSWSASANLLGATARDNDSWVSASGSGTSAAGDVGCSYVDPSNCSDLPNGASWCDATPGTQNLVAAGGASGFRIKLIQFVRAGNEAGGVAAYTGSMSITYKVQDSSAPLTGTGTFSTVPVPAPGAVALAGLAGLMGRRRR